ncbi:hypothetical protein ACFX1S_046807 [Malus domestica]
MQEWNETFAFKWSFRALLLSGDDHLRTMPGKQLGKGSRQSVPDRKFDFRFRLIALFLLVLQGYSRRGRKLSISRGSAGSALSEVRKGWAFLQVSLAMEDKGRHI